MAVAARLIICGFAMPVLVVVAVAAVVISGLIYAGLWAVAIAARACSEDY